MDPFIIINENRWSFSEGETILQIARRVGIDIPTLCNDPKLEAFGGCRLCIVDVEGSSNPLASCTTPANEGMVVKTHTDKINQYRKTLMELLGSQTDQSAIDPLAGISSQQFAEVAEQIRPDLNRFKFTNSRANSYNDDNPFILRTSERCIACYRCVRICEEVQGSSAITVINRGDNVSIAVEFDGDLKNSSCVFCGQCLQTCPTGALADIKSLENADLLGKPEKTRSVCGYCGVGCSVDIISKEDKIVGVQPAMDGPANLGSLCVKGQFAFDYVQHRDRLKTPLVKSEEGDLIPASWDVALNRAADGFKKVMAQHGNDAIYGIASGRAPIEAAYGMQKFIRAGFGTHNIDNCSRT